MQDTHTEILLSQLHDARARTLELISGLEGSQLIGPYLPTVNPLLWEIGHAAYFYEFWVLRHHMQEAPYRADIDQLYDSIGIAHKDRWVLPLPNLEETLEYMQAVLTRVSHHLQSGRMDDRRDYLIQYAIFHEDMHTEAFTYTRQTLAYPTPDIGTSKRSAWVAGRIDGDVAVPGGTFMLGADMTSGFVFDNEKWAHSVEVKPFKIARAAVTFADYLQFVIEGGYREAKFWCESGWNWRRQQSLEHPVYWRKQGDDWQHRCFDQWHSLPLDAAVIHISWYEAQAYCRWAERRLPTELEWEVAAAGEPDESGTTLASRKRHYPWGDQLPTWQHANFDGDALGTIDVGALPQGDSAFGCRQMLGNVWEWTQSVFCPYPGFEPDMYQDYSQPLFDETRVLRGGGWATRSRMMRNTWRTYYGPERNDVFAGFRTCAM